MKNTKILRNVTGGFIALFALSLLSVSLMAFSNPQSVMDLVSVSLNNTDAFSSIRGVYGGAGMAMVLLLVYLMRYNHQIAMLFLTLLWGLYALSRLITIFAEGPLGDFGSQWIVTETVLFIVALVLFILNKKTDYEHHS
jgi:hypothetical protein